MKISILSKQKRLAIHKGIARRYSGIGRNSAATQFSGDGYKGEVRGRPRIHCKKFSTKNL